MCLVTIVRKLDSIKVSDGMVPDESPDSFLYWQQSVDKLGSKLCKHYVSMFELIDKNETQRENIMSKIYSEWV